MKPSHEQALWKISAPGTPTGGAIIWSTPYMSNAPEALKKWRELSLLKDKDKKSSAAPFVCVVDDCWSFATELLCRGELEGIVPVDLWIISSVEARPGDPLIVNTVCPMCERHARRFRRTAQERILRLEKRMDILQKALKELEYEQFT